MKNILKSLAIAAALAGGFAQNAAATPFVFKADMSGALEVPANTSPAFGFTTLTLDTTANTLTVDISWSGLTGGNPAAAHIHCCIAPGSSVGVAVPFPSFPTTTSGSYFHAFNLLDSSIYTAGATGFLTVFGGGTAAGAEAALITGLFAGTAYSNIHNTVFPGGEIRGLIVQTPEPSTIALFGAGLVGLVLRRRRKSRA